MTIEQRNVDESLNAAVENGYDLDGWDSEEIAEDLHQYDASMEDVPTATLVPMIEDWKRRRAEGRCA